MSMLIQKLWTRRGGQLSSFSTGAIFGAICGILNRRPFGIIRITRTTGSPTFGIWRVNFIFIFRSWFRVDAKKIIDLSDRNDKSWILGIDDEEQEGVNFFDNNPMEISMQPVGNTFAPSIIKPPWSSDKVKFTEDRITRRLIVEISSKRSANNMTTKWRHDQEQLSVLLSNYLFHLEKLCMFDGDAPDHASIFILF
jgi:hypothetical protein